MYFNYHGKVKQIIEEQKVIKIDIVDEYNGIKPCMLLHFKKHKPMPIREHKWDEYIELIFKKPFI